MGDMHNETPPGLSWQASWQAGVVTRQQALGAGMSGAAICWRLKRGTWRQIYRGVYATFTGPLPRYARLWAAVLCVGEGARLSHETAAEVLGLADSRAPEIHVTVCSRRRVVPPAGVIVHTSSTPNLEWRFARGVPPHTFVEETVIDLVHAATDLDDVIAYVTAAFGRNLTSEARLRAVAAERRKLRWRGELGEIITAAAGGAHSVLEYRYDRYVVRAHGLPSASKQVPFIKPDGTRGYRDRYYDAYGLIVELDGKRYHPDDRRGQDVNRDNHVTATVGATLRYGWEDVTRRQCAVAAQLHAALRMRGYTGALKPCSPACGALAPAPVPESGIGEQRAQYRGRVRQVG